MVCIPFFYLLFLVLGTPGHSAGYPIYLHLFAFISGGSFFVTSHAEPTGSLR